VFAPACLSVGNTANDFNACAGVVACFTFAVVFLAAGCVFAVLGFAFALGVGFAFALVVVFLAEVVFFVAMIYSFAALPLFHQFI
jgi:hypothetical protein